MSLGTVPSLKELPPFELVKRWGDTGSMRLKAGIFSCDTTEHASRVGCHNISPTKVVRRGSGLSA